MGEVEVCAPDPTSFEVPPTRTPAEERKFDCESHTGSLGGATPLSFLLDWMRTRAQKERE